MITFAHRIWTFSTPHDSSIMFKPVCLPFLHVALLPHRKRPVGPSRLEVLSTSPQTMGIVVSLIKKHWFGIDRPRAQPDDDVELGFLPPTSHWGLAEQCLDRCLPSLDKGVSNNPFVSDPLKPFEDDADRKQFIRKLCAGCVWENASLT